MKKLLALVLVGLALVGLYGCSDEDISIQGKVLSSEELTELLEEISIDDFETGLSAKAAMTGKLALVQNSLEVKYNVSLDALAMIYFGDKTGDFKSLVDIKSTGINDIFGSSIGVGDDVFMYQTATQYYYNNYGAKEYEDRLLSSYEYQEYKDNYTSILERISTGFSDVDRIDGIKETIEGFKQYGVQIKLDDKGATKTLGLAYSGTLADLMGDIDPQLIDESFLELIKQLEKINVKFRLLIKMDNYSISNISFDFYIKGSVKYLEEFNLDLDLKLSASLSNQVDLSLFPKDSDLVDYQKASYAIIKPRHSCGSFIII